MMIMAQLMLFWFLLMDFLDLLDGFICLDIYSTVSLVVVFFIAGSSHFHYVFYLDGSVVCK